MNLKEAINLALGGDAILFLGSGASMGAKNINGDFLPSANQLADKIYSGCDDLQQSVDLYLDEKRESDVDGVSELIDFLKNQFRVSSITSSQESIALIPWKRIYTTNYDDIVEKAYSKSGKYIKSVTCADNPKKHIGSKDLICLHINGSINNLDKESFNSSFKLSDVSYNSEDFTKSVWGNLFRADLKSYSTVIFIGFSMKYDLDIKRIISKINTDKIVFIVSENESITNIKFLQKYGTVEKCGLDKFIEEVENIKATYIPIVEKNLKNTILSNFEEVVAAPATEVSRDIDVLSYYKTGKRCPELYFKKNNHYTSVVLRSAVKKILADIDAGIPAIFLHSDIGNGKSEVVEQVCIESPKQYDKYILVDCNEKISNEIELLCKDNRKKIIIVENFFNYYDVYQYFNMYNTSNNITFIFTSRTSIYKTRYEPFEFENMSVYDLNLLDENEIEDLIRIFNQYGYYPIKEMKDFTKYIRENCSSKLQAVILDIFDNSDIEKSLLQTTENLNQKDNYAKVIKFLVIVKVMSLELDFEDILNLTKIRTIDYNFEKNNDINELIDFRHRRTSIKSVVLCLWLLRHTNPQEIIEILVDAAKEADKGYTIYRKYEIFLGNIISYKHLKFILNAFKIDDSKKLDLINLFYDKIKNLSYYQNKYFFWLQYGISSMEMHDYISSEMHLRAAYKKLPINNNPFEIDNQYARLKMELMLLDSYSYNADTIKEIKKINALLTPTGAEADDEYYCYKMSASYYPKLFKKFYTFMTEAEKEEMKKIAAQNYNLCKAYINKNKNVSFRTKATDFANTFLKYSVFSIEGETYDFHVERITKYFAYGTIKINETTDEAKIHISKISKSFVHNIYDYLKINQTVKVKTLKYDKEKYIWEVSMI